MTSSSLLLAVLAGLSVPSGVKAPVVDKKPVVTTVSGVTRTDDYGWLREKGSPAVEAALKAENEFTAAVMKPTEPLQQKLYDELVGFTKEDDSSVPDRHGAYLYYWRTVKGQEHPLLCRKKTDAAPEQVVLDLNALRAKEKYAGQGDADVSDDGNLLAYSVDTTGFREFTLKVRDLKTGKDRSEAIKHTTSLAWAADNKTIFYTVEDAAKRSYRVYRHIVGSAKDALVVEEKDERFSLEVDRTRDGAFVVLASTSMTSSELSVLDAKKPTGAFRVVLPRAPDVLASIEHRRGLFYLRLNDTGREARLVTLPETAAADAGFTEVIAPSATAPLEDVDVYDSFYTVTERVNGLATARMIDFASGTSTPIAATTPIYQSWTQSQHDNATTVWRYGYESLVTPPSIFDRDLKTGAVTLRKTQEVPGYDPTKFTEERVFATAKDGTKIPISIAYRKDLKRDGSAPLLLQGYGAYGYANDVDFSTERLPLLERGVVIALAHVRGGGELGKTWHDGGRLANKANTFSDFVSCAETLIAQKYTRADKLAITGASAGGLLMGAVLNQRPELFRAALVEVPFVDVASTMLDESLPLTVTEFEEWGNPKTEADFKRMLSYSPYDNVAPKKYPSVLVTSSYNDSQVMYFEPAKWVAKLRANQKGPGVILMRMEMDPAGHGGKSGRYEELHEHAFTHAFLLSELGVGQ